MTSPSQRRMAFSKFAVLPRRDALRYSRTGKGGDCSKRFENVRRAVGGTIVADNELVGQARLRGKTVQLLGDMSSAVPRARRDGKLHESPGPPSAWP